MTYDGIYRLTNETIGNDPTNKNGSVSYGLDPVGNRQSASSSLSGVNSGSFTYNVDDETSTDTYDANGNTTTSGGKTFTFDSENHMTSMTGNGKVVTMVYDAFGNRVSKTVNGVTTQYLVEDDVNPTGLPQVVEETVNGAVTRSYTYGLERISEAQPIQGAWTPSFYEYDGAGSVRQLTNAAISVTDTYEYDAFGNAVNKTGATPNNYLYRGEQYDPDLGLYYLRARYYNPATGRFLSVDPLADEGQRRYEYAAANPVDGMDPNGSEALIEYALVPHIFPPLWIPNWCGLSGTNPMGGHLPCTPPPCPCKSHFNAAAFALTLDLLTAANGPGTTGRPNGGKEEGTWCGAYIYDALKAGGANVPSSDGAGYASSLPGAGFEDIAWYPSPSWFMASFPGSQQGDITVFGRTSKHKSGHVEGYDGANWTSYWQQRSWYPYKYAAPPAGTAMVFRYKKCQCQQ
jgi:RHS repeat-associated protein